MVRDARSNAMDTAAVSGSRVVVVDDHAGFRTTARRLLEADGWQVVGEAADGASAIEVVAVLQPDLVLLDIGLPDLDGFAVAELLATAGVRNIVLISSRDRDAYADRLSATPVLGFIAKGELEGAGLNRLLGRGRGVG